MERVILVGVRRKGAPADSSLEELARLAETAGGRVAGVMAQAVVRPHPATLVGSGKAAEIGALASKEGARTVIFDEELSPAQQRNLEALVPAKIIDRTRLILDIFARRARTREGVLQVELAQLEYLLPRLTGKGAALSQQVGGIGTRGPGERQLEYERRRIRDRISRLRKEIEGIRRERAVQRRRRLSVPLPTVAIIGYTNSGKSTLLNALAGAAVYADDRLFATLDPTTRRVRLPTGGWALWSDTVGFIRKLPTGLIAAFRATLEEILHADCLVHLVDASSKRREEQILAVQEVIRELKAEAIPQVTAYNKADLLGSGSRALLGDELLISASRKAGLDELLRRVEEALGARWVMRTLVLGPAQTGLLKEAYRNAQVVSTRRSGEGTELELRITPENFARLSRRAKGGS